MTQYIAPFVIVVGIALLSSCSNQSEELSPPPGPAVPSVEIVTDEVSPDTPVPPLPADMNTEMQQNDVPPPLPPTPADLPPPEVPADLPPPEVPAAM